MNSISGVVTEANIFQKYLIPEDSRNVRYLMKKAGHYGRSDHFFHAHITSIVFAVMAVVTSFFNAISYLLQIPFKIIVNIAGFNPLRVITELLGGLTNVTRSFVFISLGVTLVVAGFLFPAAVFTHFAPEYYDTLESRLWNENTLLKKQISQLQEDLDLRNNEMQELEKTVEILKNRKDKTLWSKIIPSFHRA